MDGGSFRCQWIGKSAQGHTVRGVVADQGDPGNRATTKMVCESALALALQLDELPGGSKQGGFLTRLRRAGMKLEVSPTKGS